MIRIDGLRMVYRRVPVLKGLSLSIAPGEVYGFMGPNGAGKTTTLRVLATLLEPTAGEALIGGHSTTRAPEQVRALIGYMPDEPGPYDEMSVGGYLGFFAAAYRVPRKDRDRVVTEILELTDLRSLATDQVEQLSRGQQQRLSLARALIHDPQVLLLDEPASGLDPRGRLEIRELLRELASMGKTIMISSHLLVDLAELCHRVGLLERGELLFEGTLDEALAQVDDRPRLEIGLAERTTEALAQLEKSSQVSAVSRRDNRLIVTLADGATAAAISRELVEAGHALEHLSRRGPDLEDVFLSLTQ